MNEKIDWIGLSLAQGLGAVFFWKLLECFGSPSSVLDAPASELKKIPGLAEGRLKGCLILTVSGKRLKPSCRS